MAKQSKKKSTLIEIRNGHNINFDEEEIALAGGGTTNAGSHAVVVPKSNRIVKNRIATLEEARKIADAQPAPKVK